MERQDATEGKGACQQQPSMPGCITWRPSHAGACSSHSSAGCCSLAASAPFSLRWLLRPHLVEGAWNSWLQFAACGLLHILLRKGSQLCQIPSEQQTQPDKGASEEKWSFGALIQHLKEPLSLLWLQKKLRRQRSQFSWTNRLFYSINVGLGIYPLCRWDFFRITGVISVEFCNILLTSTQGQRPAQSSSDQLV